MPMPIRPSKSKGKGGKNIVNVKTVKCDTEMLETSSSFMAERSLKPNQHVEPALPIYEPSSQMSNSSQLLICPMCGYHSKKLQDFIQKPSVGRKSIIQTRKQFAKSSKMQVHKRSSSCSSDSSSSLSSSEKKIAELRHRVKKLSEALEYIIKECNDSKKRKLKRQTERKLKKELLCAPVVKQKIACDDECLSVATLPDYNVFTSASSNHTLNKRQNQKQTQKSVSKHISAPKPTAAHKKAAPVANCSLKSTSKTKKAALVHACSPKPLAQIKKRKTNYNPSQRKQPTFAASACPPSFPMPDATPNNGYRMKIEDGDFKISFEEKRKLGEELLKLDESAMAAVTTIIKLMEPSCYDASSGNELELDIDVLKQSTLRELQKYVETLKNETYTNSSITKIDSSSKAQNKEQKDFDDDTSSTDSTSSSNSSTSSSSSEPYLYSDDSSSSSNTSNDGKKSSTGNEQLTNMTSTTRAMHSNSTASPVKVDQNLGHPCPEFYFPNLQQTVIKNEPYNPYFDEYKSSLPGPSTSRSVLQPNNYTGASCGLPKNNMNRVGMISTIDVDRQFGYTRITKRVEQAGKKTQSDTENRRFLDSIAKAKKKMKMREKVKNQVQNQADQPGKGGMEIKK